MAARSSGRSSSKDEILEAAHAAASSVAKEVRMVAALGAVTGFDDWAPTLLKDADPSVLQQELIATVRDVLHITQRV